MSLRYHNVVSRCRYFARDEHGWCVRAWKNREGNREDERVDPQETSRSEVWRIKDMALDRHFKSIISLLLNHCNRTFTSPVCAIKRELRYNDAASVTKHEEEEKNKKDSITFEPSTTLRKFDDRSHDRVQPITFTTHEVRRSYNWVIRERSETTNDSLAMKIQNRL